MPVENKFPSEAYRDAKGEYHPCEKNQPYHYQVEAGLTQAHDRGQKEHPLSMIKGYCERHVTLGCEICSAELKAAAAPPGFGNVPWGSTPFGQHPE
jgi:hypothetical protein